jgi:hypothetical protein
LGGLEAKLVGFALIAVEEEYSFCCGVVDSDDLGCLHKK